MIDYIKQSAQAVGIALVVSNSEDRIETQLNSLTHKVEKGDVNDPTQVTRLTDLPIMLISWDIETQLNFDNNGFLDNPSSSITALLMKKAVDLTKDSLEDASVEMGQLFQIFIQDLWSRLMPLQKSINAPLSQVTYKLVPKYGAGRHSGVLCKWLMRVDIAVCDD